MDTIKFQLRGEHVALCDLLKLAGIADSGGQGKLMIPTARRPLTASSSTARPRKLGPIKPCSASGSEWRLWRARAERSGTTSD
jgi:ribosome-associated protein